MMLPKYINKKGYVNNLVLIQLGNHYKFISDMQILCELRTFVMW